MTDSFPLRAGLSRRFWLGRRQNRSHLALALSVLAHFVAAPSGGGATFVLAGGPRELEEVTDKVEVTFRAVRFNPVRNAWDFDAVVRNVSAPDIPGPMVLLAVEWTGSAGPLNADGSGGPSPGHPYWDLSPQLAAAGLHSGDESAARRLSLGRQGNEIPTLVVHVYAPAGASAAEALAVTETLSADGRILGSVGVTEAGPGGAHSFVSDAGSGLVTLGGVPGKYLWRFEAEGHVPVWRAANLVEAGPVMLVSPRLTPRGTEAPLNNSGPTTLRTSDDSIRITFPAGSGPAGAGLSLTALTEQALPADLPRGWSPAQAFWMEGPTSVDGTWTVQLQPWYPTPGGTPLILAHWDSTTGRWRVTHLSSSPGAASVTFELVETGPYVLALPDPPPTAPPAPTVGSALQDSTAAVPIPSTFTASGVVRPPVSAVSTNPVDVTAQAELTVTSSTSPSPSGIQVRAGLTEIYELTDGDVWRLPFRELLVNAYRRPGESNPAVLKSQFPLRPMTLLDSTHLLEATVRADIRTLDAFPGAILRPTGNSVKAGSLEIVAAPNAVSRPQAVLVRELPISDLGLLSATGVAAFRAFEITLSGLADGRELELRLDPPAVSDGDYLLVRAHYGGPRAGLIPVARLEQRQGILRSRESSANPRLPGLTKSGQYAFVDLASPLAVLAGTVRTPDGQAVNGAVIRAPGQPWMTPTDASGAYRFALPEGSHEIVAVQSTGFGVGRGRVTVGPDLASQTQNLVVTSEAPRVESIVPADTATGVSPLTDIVATFSRPVGVDRAGDPVLELRGPDGAGIAGRAQLDPGGMAARLIPENPLGLDMRYTVLVSAMLRSPTGETLEGPHEYSFTTRAAPADRPAGAQLFAEAPGPDGFARVIGTAGIAQPRQPVIFVNDTTGQTTTLTAQADGSFTNGILADVSDRLRVVLVNQEGTRTEIPVGRQVFPDGSVALFSGGGMIQAANDTIAITVDVPPGATLGRTRFHLQPLRLADLPDLTSNTPPEQAGVLGLFRLRTEGDALKSPLHFTVQVDDANLPALPPGGTRDDIAFVAAEVKSVADGAGDAQTHVTAYEFLGTPELTDAPAEARSALDRVRPHFGIYMSLVALTSPDALISLFGTIQYSKTAIQGITKSAEFPNGPLTPDIATETVLGGATVRVRSGSLENSRPFTLQPGELYSTSDEFGRFKMLAPAGGGFIVVGTHPAFPRQFGRTLNTLRAAPGQPFAVSFVYFDRRRPLDENPPAITAFHTPVFPGRNGTATLVVRTTDESPPAFPRVEVRTVEPFGAVVLATPSTNAFTWSIEAHDAERAELRIAATDGAGNSTGIPYLISFAAPAPLPPDPALASNTNDLVGPFVVDTIPPTNSVGFTVGDLVQIVFNEPVHQAVAQRPADYFTLSPDADAPFAFLAAQQRVMVLRYPNLEPDTTYSLVVHGVPDVSNNRMDQDPGTHSPPEQSFTLTFRTQPVFNIPLPGIENGGGAVLAGGYAFILDRGAGVNSGGIVVYDVSVPRDPARVAFRSIFGQPRSMAWIPDYAFALDFTPPGAVSQQPPAIPYRRNLLAVAHNDPIVSDANGVVQTMHHLRILDASSPADPQALPTIAVSTLSLDGSAVLTRLAWSPPFLVAVENSLASPVIHAVRLQTFLLGDALRAMDPFVRDAGLPDFFDPGRDVDGDGDYVDPGDQLPLPGRFELDFPPGEEGLLTLDPAADGVAFVSSSRFIHDVVVDGKADFVGALIGPGRDVLQQPGAPQPGVVEFPTSFRCFLVGQRLPAGPSSVFYPGWSPKKALLVNTGNRRRVLLNLISLDAQTNRLALVDVTDPALPIPLPDIAFPRGRYGLLQGSSLDEQGRIVLTTATPVSEAMVVLDPNLLLNAAPTNGSPHPAILSMRPVEGGGNTPFDSVDAGLSALTLRNRNDLVQAAPLVRLVQADSRWFDAFGDPFIEDMADEVRAMADATVLRPARHGTNSTLVPADPAVHYYLLVSAPGGAGPEIQLKLESLDWTGQALPRSSNGMPPAILPSVALHRASSDAARSGFNLYLSRPVALLQSTLSATEIAAVQASLERNLLYAGNKLRISYADSMSSNPVLGPFANQGLFGVAGGGAGTGNGVAAVAKVVPTDLPFILESDPRVRLRTTVDAINRTTCPGSARLHLAVSRPCSLTLQIDGQPARNVVDEDGNQLPEFSRIPFTPGLHAVQLFPDTVGAPGAHPYELVAALVEGEDADFSAASGGVIDHEVEIHHAFPIGHTVIEGIDLWDGHLSLSRQDVLIPGRRLSLDFTRSYSSQGNSTDGPLGAGWMHTYHVRLVEQCGVFRVTGGEGSGNAFTDPRPDPVKAARYLPLLPPGTAPGDLEFFAPQIGFHSVLIRNRRSATNLFFFTKAAIRHEFVHEPALDTAGSATFVLHEIREPNGNALRLAYRENDADPTTLDSVTELDALGGLPKRGFAFSYTNVAGAERIATLRGFNRQTGSDLLGLSIEFDYDSLGNLVGVIRHGTTVAETRVETYEYTLGDGPAGHNLTAAVDPNGHVIRYAYGAPGAQGYYDLGRPFDGLPPHEVVQTATRVGAARPGFAATPDVVRRFRFDWIASRRFVSDPRSDEGVPDSEYALNGYGATTKITAPLGQVTLMEWATDHTNGSVRDEAGNPVHDVLLTRKVDAEGQEHLFRYEDGRGNLTGETIRFASGKAPVTLADGTPVNQVTNRTTYHPLFNTPVRITDFEGHTTVNEYDDTTGNLLRRTDAESYVTRWTYDANGDRRTQRDARDLVTEFVQYDLYGNAAVIRDPLGNTARNTYDERSRLRETSDTFTHHSRFDYDGLDRPVRAERLNDLGGLPTGPGAVTTTAYLSGGEPRAEVSPLGLMTTNLHDALNRRIATVQGGVRQADGSLVTYTNRLEYDRSGNVVVEVDGRGVIQRHKYDELNRRTRTDIEGPFGPNLLLARLEYDRVGNLTNTVDLHGLSTAHILDGLYREVETRLPFAGAVMRMRFDRAGNKVLSTDVNGNASHFVYDRIYRLVRATDAEGNEIRYSHDPVGNVTNVLNVSSGLNLAGWFDARDRAIRILQTGPGLPAAGYETRNAYVDERNEIAVTNPREFTTRTRRDGLDRVAFTTVDDGGLSLTARFTYDASGDVKSVSDAQNADEDVRHDYDALGRRIRSTYVSTPDDQGSPVLEEIVYDASGDAVATRDRRGFFHRFTYDNLRRGIREELREDLSAGGAWLAVSQVAYDDGTHQITTTEANGNSTRAELDALGRPLRIHDPAGQFAARTYDGISLRSSIDRRGHHRDYTYDKLDRIVLAQEHDGSGALRTTVSVEYDDASRRVTTTDRRGLASIVEMDALGRTVRHLRSGAGLAALYGSDPLLLSTTAYDGNGNVVREVDGDGHVTSQEYDGADRRISTTEGAGSAVEATTRFTYDNAGNLLTVKDGRAHGGFFDVRHTYDARYRRVTTENGKGKSPASPTIRATTGSP